MLSDIFSQKNPSLKKNVFFCVCKFCYKGSKFKIIFYGVGARVSDFFKL